MMNKHKDNLTSFVRTFIHELTRMGVKHAVVSPGSRSTPLAVLLRSHPEIKVWMNLDERSAGFFALGIAKTTRTPALLVCSSGTAAANYYPAVIEAKYSRVPLIAMTADRPHELREVGAPQSIDQIKLYGSHVKYYMDLPVPGTHSDYDSLAGTVAKRSVLTALTAPMGPVHINAPFQEPLMPEESPLPSSKDNQKMPIAPYGEPEPNRADVEHVANLLERASRPLIITGPVSHQWLANTLLPFAKEREIPILADPLSQCRGHDANVSMSAYDTFLRDTSLHERLWPDLVIRFGAMPVSKALSKFLKAVNPDNYVMIDSGNGWLDPTHQATNMIYANGDSFLKQIQNLPMRDLDFNNWLLEWQTINEATVKTLQNGVHDKPWFEGTIVHSLIEHMNEGQVLFAGNSMPIRDVDTFYNQEKPLEITANRGANGIDGIVSSALGYAAGGSDTYLVIGDLSFFHDMNGLLAGKQHQISMTIIVINNNGGGIFSFLPQAKEAANFEELFGTPTDLDIAGIANIYNAHYFKAACKEELNNALEKERQLSGLKIIETVTNRESNTAIHQQIWQDVKITLRQKISGSN